jgi:hypothetical protein
MSNYGNRFVKLLSEKDEMSDEEAMTQTLDKGTEVKDFDVEGVQPGVAPVPTMGAVQKKMYDDLTGWINELDRFTEYLNGTGPDSVQTRLNSAEPDTLFDKIATAETKKIARVSVELSSLSQMFKGYVATANDSKYRFQ